MKCYPWRIWRGDRCATYGLVRMWASYDRYAAFGLIRISTVPYKELMISSQLNDWFVREQYLLKCSDKFAAFVLARMWTVPSKKSDDRWATCWLVRMWTVPSKQVTIGAQLVDWFVCEHYLPKSDDKWVAYGLVRMWAVLSKKWGFVRRL